MPSGRKYLFASVDSWNILASMAVSFPQYLLSCFVDEIASETEEA